MKLVRLFNDKAEELLLVFFLANITIWVFVQVIMRYVFHNSLSWSEEFVRWCFIWFIWVGVSYGFKVRKHIAITSFLSFFNDKTKSFINILVELIILWCMLYLFYYGYKQILNPIIAKQTSIVLVWPLLNEKVSMVWLYGSLPFGALFSSFRIIQNIIVDLKEFRHGKTKEV